MPSKRPSSTSDFYQEFTDMYQWYHNIAQSMEKSPKKSFNTVSTCIGTCLFFLDKKKVYSKNLSFVKTVKSKRT